MLDMIIKMAADTLGLTQAEIADMRERLTAEVMSGAGRRAAQTKLISAAGSSTLLNAALEAADQAVDKMRDRVKADVPKALASLFAHDLAVRLRDDANAAWERNKGSRAPTRLEGEMPAELTQFVARLATHEVTPNHLKNQNGENVAIIADLLRWKTADPLYKDENNPWRQVYGIYAERSLAMPGDAKLKKSAPGSPPVNRRHAKVKWYDFAMRIRLFGSRVWLGDIRPLECELDDEEDNRDVTLEQKRHTDVAEPDTLAAELEPPTLTATRAHELAEAMFEAQPSRLHYLWPEGMTRGDLDPERLIPALEQELAGSKVWSGTEPFLAAAKAGTAREYVADKRRAGVQKLAAELLQGDTKALADASAAGLNL